MQDGGRWPPAARVGEMTLVSDEAPWRAAPVDIARADRIEVGTAADATASDQLKDRGQEPYLGFSTVILSGVVEKNPPNDDKITIHNRNERRDLEITVDEEFIVLRPDDTFIRASQLRQGDSVVIKAFRDPRGEYIAQTIRLQAR